MPGASIAVNAVNPVRCQATAGLRAHAPDGQLEPGVPGRDARGAARRRATLSQPLTAALLIR